MRVSNVYRRCSRVLRLGVCLGVTLAASLQASQEVAASLVSLSSIHEGAAKTGTGFVVALHEKTAFIVTAAHVVKGTEYVTVRFATEVGQAYAGAVLQNDPQEDLSLIQVPNPPSGVRHLAISPVSLEMADRVILPGFPRRSFNPLYTPSAVSGYQGTRLVLSGRVEPGNSGGPVLKGPNAVGMVVSQQRSFPQAIPGATLRLAIENWLGDTVSLPQPFAPPVAPPTPPEPTEDEMKIALLEAMQRRGGTRGSGDSISVDNPISGMKLEIREFEKIGCKPATDSVGFSCTYRYSFTSAFHSNEGTSAGERHAAGVNMIWNLLSGTQGTDIATRLFVKSEQGWMMDAD